MVALKVLVYLAQIGKEEIVCIAEIHCLELAGSPDSDRGALKRQYSYALHDWYKVVTRLFDGSGIEQKFYI
jgi:hypothetical protein